MLWIARITVTLALLFSLLMGVQTFFMPEQAALALGFGTDLTDMGWNTFRGDIGAFFLAAAIFTALGLFAGQQIGVCFDPNHLGSPIFRQSVLYGSGIPAHDNGMDGMTGCSGQDPQAGLFYRIVFHFNQNTCTGHILLSPYM